MAICGKLNGGQDNSCPTLVKGHFQEIKIANFEDVEVREVAIDCETATKTFNAKVSLKEDAVAYSFTGVGRGNSVRAWYSFDVDDNQIPIYTHHVQIIVTGATEEQKCILKGLGSGLFVAFAKLKSWETPESGIVPAVEVYGLSNGLVAQPYDYNLAESGGVIVIELASSEGYEEPDPSYIYSSPTAGSELEDWDADFVGPTA